MAAWLGRGLWVGGSRVPKAGGMGGGQFLMTAIQPGAGVPRQALSPRSLPVPLGNESPDDRPGQLNPSPGTEGERLERRSQMLRLQGATQTH